jgi:hypothetical protein
MKRCSTCGDEKALSEFNRRAKAHDGLQSRCRECSRHWYLRNRAEHIVNVRKIAERARAQRRAKLLAYLLEHPCVDCGERDPCVLEFDHVRGIKEGNISHLLQNASWQRVEAEIAKCEVRCANCHRRATARRADWNKAAGHFCEETRPERALGFFASEQESDVGRVGLEPTTTTA